jgi:predicted lipoprotein with Yx(FWY)xxD motif
VKRISTIGASSALAILVTVLAAGCGSSSSASVTPTTSSSSAASTVSQGGSTAAQPGVVIASFKTPQDGTLITGMSRRTLYVFKPDEKSTSAHDKNSTCYGGCAAVWPPVIASQAPEVAGLASKALVGLTTRKDGTKQVTYNGLPLYYFAADTKAGQATGNHLKDGFGVWTGMLPNGKLAPDGSS